MPGLGVARQLDLVTGDTRPLGVAVLLVPDVPPDDDLVHPGRHPLRPVHGALQEVALRMEGGGADGARGEVHHVLPELLLEGKLASRIGAWSSNCAAPGIFEQNNKIYRLRLYLSLNGTFRWK